MRVLVMMEYSGVVRDAFIARGHDAISCDLLPTERPGPHSQLHCFDFLERYPQWDLMVAHPPCTYLTSAGLRWLYHPDDRGLPAEQRRPHPLFPDRADRQKAAVAVVERLWAQPHIPRVAIENPIGKLPKLSVLGPASQVIQPWWFGHEETKATCLWLKNLPLLKPTNIVGPPPDDPEKRKAWEKCFRHTNSPDRWKDRSRTYQGIGDAIAAQWGGYDDTQGLEDLVQ